MTRTTRMAGTATASSGRRLSVRGLVLSGLAVCLVLAGVVSIWASSNPDGLEYVAAKLGFDTTAGEHATAGSPFADYLVAGIGQERLSGAIAGVVGVLVVAGVAFGLMHLLARRGPRDALTADAVTTDERSGSRDDG
ncbi:cobalt/nickel transport system permease protein/cobalt/nickel transport protein [Knoellia remsis]|uniref:Cobalt/nickel transport system permease protein/cobalt/nickel transport protein n=1 Tax=Knoellia remsis TaxID=407159 RepID=A0A2T0UAI4_9MICO|nr:PDGLE domain-containing protein [Knoellia remsis]PRY54878.1 cobalt/nickel transport system permease protein/cobalt/nickel transport protein [Knoellia remsis]